MRMVGLRGGRGRREDHDEDDLSESGDDEVSGEDTDDEVDQETDEVNFLKKNTL